MAARTGPSGIERGVIDRLGPLEVTTISLIAGGIDAIPGDYVYGDHRLPFQDAGLWGVFRVVPRTASPAGLTQLRRGPADRPQRPRWSWRQPAHRRLRRRLAAQSPAPASPATVTSRRWLASTKPSRRWGWPAVAALAILAVACSSGANRVAATKTSPATTAAVSRQSTLIEAQSDLPVGTSRFVFGIADPDNNVITTGQPQVFVARDERSAPFGPFPATWQTWSPSAGDAFGKPPIPGFFVAQVNIPTPGTWLIVVRDAQSGQTIEAAATIPVVSHRWLESVAQRSPSRHRSQLPTPTRPRSIPDSRQHQCTTSASTPPCTMASQRCWSSPRLSCVRHGCAARCDEVLAIYNRVGPARGELRRRRDLPEP